VGRVYTEEKEHGRETHLVFFLKGIVEHPARDGRVVGNSKLECSVENGGSEGIGLSVDGPGWDVVGAGPGACSRKGVGFGIGHGGGKKRKARCAPGKEEEEEDEKRRT
jgi:hypothetical protein